MFKNIFFLFFSTFLSIPLSAQTVLEAYVQSQGAVISNTFGNIESTVIVGEPIVSGMLDQGTFAGSSFGFLGQTAQNDPPVADAGPDQQAIIGDLIRLDGTNSFDPNTNPLTYSWTSLDGLTLDDPSLAQPAFTAPNVLGRAVFRFQLIVNDGQEDSDPDVVEITVFDPDWITVVYTNSSPLIAKVTIDGAVAEEGDLVGAFVNGECRGSGEVFFFEGESFVNINLQGESTGTANFQVVDFSDGIICDAINTLTFTPPQDYGNPSNPILIEAVCGNGGDCDGATLSNFTDPVPSGTYKASNNIISDDVVATGSVVTFQAANSIMLQPGFHAQAESSFTAIIQDCNSNARIATLPKEEPIHPKPNTGITQVKVYPNPFSNGFRIAFQLEVPQRIGIRILDVHGRLVGQAEFFDLETGLFSRAYDLPGIPPGNYIVQILSNSQYLENQRIVKMR